MSSWTHPVKLVGGVRAHKARIVITDTHLHVWRTATAHSSYEITGPAVKSGTGWTVETVEYGLVRFAQTGCNCSWWGKGKSDEQLLDSLNRVG